MTRAKVASLEVPLEFAWETLIETAQTKNGGVQKALDCFYHAEEDCLVRHFDRLFGTDKFSFDIKNPQKHKEILEILNGVIMEDVDCQMDILGWVYEQHLRTGSSAARDLGQFFTDRFICEYMTELCAPGFKSAGVPESVCDPTMGTGGFLTAFVKFYNKHHADKPIDWAVQQKEIHGCDTDPKVAGVARLNLFMETGGNRSTNLLTHDSLYGDLTQTQYDVILANMPFGLKGIKHAECCERVKNLKIRGTKSEPLFLQLMMVSLARGGRCAVVVPDGMLVNSSSCHNDTRKYLLDHFELKRVIKMNGQYFMNTGIKPSILFFENTGKPTTAVEFWEVLRNEKGESTETMLVSVPRAKIDASCSFDMRRYLESDKPVANPAGFPMVKLSDISDLYSGKANRDADSGDIPFFASSGSVGKRDKHNFEGKYIITARTQSIGSVSYYDGKLWASDNTILLKVKQETRHFQEESGLTRSGRSKEQAEDYRYFPEPDLVPVAPAATWIEELRAQLPERPSLHRKRLKEQWAVPDKEMAAMINADVLDIVEQTVLLGADPTKARTWWLGEISRLANEKDIAIAELSIAPRDVAEIVALVAAGELTDKLARQVVEGVIAGEGTPAEVVAKRGIKVVNDDGALMAAIEKVCAEQAETADKVRNGHVPAAGALIGAVMKETKGQADAARVRELLLGHLGQA
jgi:hypothetical protein